ncbi:uncharacterized protein LOC143449579 [Clavelina lepadiformis]|uniref:N-acetyltransferase domain-containing protein n=1 Tax=Clavelina lepadiformis TaxID=159417 RepID=A0ABP0H2M4_CLALP
MFLFIEVVSEEDWPTVKELMTESLCDLDFYKSLCANDLERRRFVSDYVKSEHSDGRNLFWCGKVTNEPVPGSQKSRKCCSFTSVKTSELFMAGKLIPPAGFTFNKVSSIVQPVCPNCDANRLVVASSQLNQCTRTDEESIALKLKYPTAMQKLHLYHEWYQKCTEEITVKTNNKFWQCSHIAVSPGYRKSGMAASGMREAIQTFMGLADTCQCHLVLVNTGVKECRFACKQAGFHDVTTLTYEGKPRWLMLNDMKQNDVISKELISSIKNSISAL